MPGANQLITAIKSKNIEKLSKLLEKMDLNDVNSKKNGETALHFACRKNYNEAVDLLVAKNGIDVNVKNSRGKTPLHVAAIDNNVHAVTKILTNTEVDANIQNNLERTPLHVACWCNHHQIVSALLAIPGVDVNVADDYGRTPVMWSAGFCHEETLKVMLEDTRVDLDAKDKDGQGLEQQVGRGQGDSIRKEKCLEMITNERRKRGNRNVGKWQQSQDGNDGQCIEKKEKLNKQMEDLEKRFKDNLDIENTEGNGEDKGNLVTGNDKLMEGNGEKEKGNVVTDNEELMEGNGEKEKGSVVTDNEELMEGNEEEVKKEGIQATVNVPKRNKYSTLCWCCSKEDCKLYKCGGCKRARYCSDECLRNDWDVHGNYRLKQMQQRKKIKAEAQEAEQELEGPLDLE